MSEKRRGRGEEGVAAGGAAPVCFGGAGARAESVGDGVKSGEERGRRSQMRRSLSDDPVTRREREGITRRVLTKSVWAIVVEIGFFVYELRRNVGQLSHANDRDEFFADAPECPTRGNSCPMIH